MGTNRNGDTTFIDDDDLIQRFPTPKTVVAFVVYAYGLTRMALALNKSHGELSKLLNDEDRNLDVDLADRIMEIANSDLLAMWFGAKAKAKLDEPSKGDLVKTVIGLQKQMETIAEQLAALK